ncbi:MAG: dockerin type I repeat-containing protein [Clostridia bacterium]|nr:dockerin type I repeat-containing protein [Clostridia bacterium]
MRKLNLFKKIVSASLAAVTAASVSLCAGAASLNYGDINGDGYVNSIDALAALSHSLGKVTYTGDALTRADVNGDGDINAYDALLILYYSVDKITEFPVENTMPEAPSSSKEILSVYSSALDKARNELPAYRVDVVSDSELTNMTLSGMLAESLTEEEKNQLIEEQKKSADSHEENYVIAKQGSSASLSNLPSQFKETNASLFKSVTCSVNSKGNYVINIKFKDVVNPKDTDPIVTCMGAPSYNQIKEVIDEQYGDGVSSKGVTVDVSSIEIRYSNAEIVCEMNPKTNEMVSIEYKFTDTMKIDVSVKRGLLPLMNMSMTNKSTIDRTYSGFAY